MGGIPSRPSSIRRRCTLVLLWVTALAACSPGTTHDAARPLRVAYGPWPGFDVIAFAELSDLFAARGVDVELLRLDNQFDATRALLRGRVDLAFTSVADLVQARVPDDDLRLLLVTNVSNGSDGIAAAPGITSVADLAGKRVGAKLRTVNELILVEALEHHGVSADRVRIEDLSNGVALQRFADGTLDAVVLWEPDLSAAAAAVGGNVIHRTSDLDSVVIDVLVGSAEVVASRRDDVERFVLAWFDVMQAVEDTPEAVFTAVGRDLGRAPEAFAADYAGLRKGDRALNRAMIERGSLAAEVPHIKALLGATTPGGGTLYIEPAIVAGALDARGDAP